MKRLFLAILFTAIGNITFSQNPQGETSESLSERMFNQYFDQFGMQKTDAMRMQIGKSWMNRYSLTSYQVKKLAQLFYSDEERLVFAMSVYPSVRDKENFYEVYDVFAFFSTVFRLHDFVNGFNVHPPLNQPPVMQFPPFMYPVWEGYIGPRGCQMPVAEEDFNFLAFQVQQQPDENQKFKLAVDISRNNCLSVAQQMKVATLLMKEAKRLNFLKSVSQYAFDQRNLEAAAQVFNQPSHRDDFLVFIQRTFPSTGFDPMPPHNPCLINDFDFRDIVKMIDKQSFNNTRLSMARQTISARKCFSSQQILTLVKLMEFETTRMELAKFAYDYCIDREKYFLVTDAFEYESSKEELLKYIGGR